MPHADALAESGRTREPAGASPDATTSWPPGAFGTIACGDQAPTATVGIGRCRWPDKGERKSIVGADARNSSCDARHVVSEQHGCRINQM